MPEERKERIALVTAASRGIGYACAEALAQQGNIIEICSRDRVRIDSAAKAITESTGAQVHSHVCDLRNRMQNKQLIDAIIMRHGRIDILVFNSGSPPSGPFEHATDEDWGEGHGLCMEPTVLFLRLVLPIMESQGWGRIVFINSIFAKEPDPGYAVSSVERAAQLALMKCVARKSAANGVTINAVLPGYVDTPLVHNYASKIATIRQSNIDNVLSEWAYSVPRGKFATPTEIGAVVTFLASDSGGNISGAAIQSDGAMLRSL